ncbi:lysine N(6)-hydroxylase/L-ornithine N(5)-oxygenase family protein [Pontibacillus salicampi]|uniref:L-lysine N6-monooxygenase MbtG n=1 Tax=Pontibacillus salicampi TaxID=1449801 RepID=A0ABV6LPU1_9BACI
MTQTYDVIGVGLGPFNLGMAALTADVEDVNTLFIERKPFFQWHPGLLLEGTTLQVPFLADLVTMAHPSSRFSFLSYLHDKGRLYSFYFLESFHIPRKEYNAYCQWVSEQLSSCQFDTTVTDVEWDNDTETYRVTAKRGGTILTYKARHVVFGMGTEPSVPNWHAASSDKVFHSASFAERQQELRNANHITVIGSGQSAAEVFLTLLTEQKEHGYTLEWYTRSKGFFPMEYSKLGLEHFSPEYTNYFYQLEQEKKDAVLPKQDLLYKGISADTIAEIYHLLYERSIDNAPLDVRLQAKTSIMDITSANGKLCLEGYQWEQEREFMTESDYVIAATGYQSPASLPFPGIKADLEEDELGRPIISQHYEVKTVKERVGNLFIQNGEMHTHGVGAPDLGLGAYRNATIINQIVGREVFTIRSKNVFQQFGLEESAVLTK